MQACVGRGVGSLCESARLWGCVSTAAGDQGVNKAKALGGGERWRRAGIWKLSVEGRWARP